MTIVKLLQISQSSLAFRYLSLSLSLFSLSLSRPKWATVRRTVDNICLNSLAHTMCVHLSPRTPLRFLSTSLSPLYAFPFLGQLYDCSLSWNNSLGSALWRLRPCALLSLRLPFLSAFRFVSLPLSLSLSGHIVIVTMAKKFAFTHRYRTHSHTHTLCLITNFCVLSNWFVCRQHVDSSVPHSSPSPSLHPPPAQAVTNLHFDAFCALWIARHVCCLFELRVCQ